MRSRTAMRVGAPAIVCLSVGVGIGRAFAPGSNLYINGGLASSRVIEHDGSAYAPISDVAKALNFAVVPRADGFAIAPAGGANQVGGLTGKIGDRLNSGQATFTVVKVIRGDHYTKQFDTGDASPSSASDDLVIVVIRIKNATSKDFTLSVVGGSKTALTDQDSHAYEAGRFSSDFRSAAPSILPGSAVGFALGFSVPKSEKLGDFVYELNAGGSATIRPTIFRVSLATANP